MEQKTILVLEDEKALNDAIKFKLEKRGYRVLQAFCAKDGMEFLKREKPDFIWLDILLPGMSGIDFLEQMRKDPGTKNERVVIVSASGGPDTQEKATALGAVDYIVKSDLSLEEIIERVNKNI